jgi:hypothetical protein
VRAVLSYGDSRLVVFRVDLVENMRPMSELRCSEIDLTDAQVTDHEANQEA